jgi:hypothetical protein
MTIHLITIHLITITVGGKRQPDYHTVCLRSFLQGNLT